MTAIFDREMYEEMPLDRLKKVHEDLEKDNETIRRENMLFDSYIKRHQRPEDLEHKEETKEAEKKGKKGKRGQQQVEEVKTLSLQEKFEIANSELEELKKSILEGEKKSEELLEYLKAVLDEIDMKIAEIKREAHEFKRDIVMGSENSRTGKIVAEKLIKYIEERIRLKEQAIDKYSAQNQELEKKIKKEKKKINKRDQASDHLQFIDFHQLQIENKKLVTEIDDRNKQLLSLKVTYGKSTIRLTNIKEELASEERELTNINNKIKEFNAQIQQNVESIQNVQENIHSISRKQKKYKMQKIESENMPGVSDYIKLKQEEAKYEREVKNCERRIVIAQNDHEKAVKLLRKYKQLN